jgi:hypothetical protein
MESEEKQLHQTISIEQKDILEIIDYIAEYPNAIKLLKETIDLLKYELNNEDYDLHIFMNHDPECYDPYLRINILRDYYPRYEEKNDVDWDNRIESKITGYISKKYDYSCRHGLHPPSIGEGLTAAGKLKYDQEQEEEERIRKEKNQGEK